RRGCRPGTVRPHPDPGPLSRCGRCPACPEWPRRLLARLDTSCRILAARTSISLLLTLRLHPIAAYTGHHQRAGEEVATMPKRRRLETGTAWVELTTTQADWKNADPALLRTMLGQL